MFAGVVIQFGEPLFFVNYTGVLKNNRTIVSLVVYLILAAEFFMRYFKDRPLKQKTVSEKSSEAPSRGTITPRLFALSGALVFGSLCLFIRCVYRAIEIGSGFESPFSHTQVYLSEFTVGGCLHCFD
jgi:hypothetical protein